MDARSSINGKGNDDVEVRRQALRVLRQGDAPHVRTGEGQGNSASTPEVVDLRTRPQALPEEGASMTTLAQIFRRCDEIYEEQDSLGEGPWPKPPHVHRRLEALSEEHAALMREWEAISASERILSCAKCGDILATFCEDERAPDCPDHRCF